MCMQHATPYTSVSSFRRFAVSFVTCCLTSIKQTPQVINMGNANCDTGVVISYLRHGDANTQLICDTAPRSRHIPQIGSAPPGTCWHGAGPSLKPSHGRNGPGLEEIPGILVHPQTFRSVSQITLICDTPTWLPHTFRIGDALPL